MSWRDTWNNFKARFKDSRPLSEPVKDATKEPEKTWDPLVWAKRVSDWGELAVCSHCGHSTYDPRVSRVCPECGCKGSHEIKVVRWEWEETYCEHDHPEFDFKLIDSCHRWPFQPMYKLIRNKKLVTWAGCSAKEEEK